MNPDYTPKQPYVIRYTMKRQDIQAFVNELHSIQSDMIEELVAREERKGFPQVKAILDNIAR